MKQALDINVHLLPASPASSVPIPVLLSPVSRQSSQNLLIDAARVCFLDLPVPGASPVPVLGPAGVGIARTEVAAMPSTISSPESFIVMNVKLKVWLSFGTWNVENWKDTLRSCCWNACGDGFQGVFIHFHYCLLDLSLV
jgi:hypothetical protein